MFKIRPPFPKGFHCVTYNPLKIKLCFRPSEVVTYVNKTIRFYLSLRHIGGHWRVKRDTIPANCKWSIYKLFYTKQSFAIDDENILEKIGDIYKLLVRWSQKHQKFRLTKFEVSEKVQKAVASCLSRFFPFKLKLIVFSLALSVWRRCNSRFRRRSTLLVGSRKTGKGREKEQDSPKDDTSHSARQQKPPPSLIFFCQHSQEIALKTEKQSTVNDILYYLFIYHCLII